MSAITGELADLAEAMIGDATRVLVNARRHLHRQGEGAAGRPEAAVAELDTILDRAGRAIAQTRTRLSGIDPGLGDPAGVAARPGRRARSPRGGWASRWSSVTRRSSPTTTDGIVLDYERARGQPGRRAAAGPGDRSDQESVRHATRRGHRGPRLRRGQGRRDAHRPRGQHRGDPAQGQAVGGAPRGRARPRLPPAGQAAHRLGGTHLPT